MTASRPLAIGLVAVFLLSLFASTASAWPYNDADEDYLPDEAETALCGQVPDTGGVTGGQSPADCAGGQVDWSTFVETTVLTVLCSNGQPTAATLEGVLDLVDPAVFDAGDCTGGYWEGPTVSQPGIGVPPTPGGADEAWDLVQTAFFDTTFLALQDLVEDLSALTAPQGVAFNLTKYTQNGDTEILDHDGDGSADAWRLSVDKTSAPPNSQTRYVQSDFIWGGISNGTAMVIDTNNGNANVAGLDVDTAGSAVVLNIIRGVNENTTYATITLDPAAADSEQVVLSVKHPSDRFFMINPVAGFQPFWAPMDLFKVVLSKPSDLDGDGFVNQREFITGAEAGHLISHPVNFRSIPGDADADGCLYAQEGGADTSATNNPCVVFPFKISVLNLDSDLGTDELIVWDDVTITFRLELDPLTTFLTPQSRVGTEWRLYRTNVNNSAAASTTICEDTNANIVAGGNVHTFTCTWDTTDTTDNADVPQAVNGYFAWFRYCVNGGALGETCRLVDFPTQFFVQNRPAITYNSFTDAVSGNADDDRDNWISDIAVLNVTATHPGHDITEFDIDVVPCNGSGNSLCSSFNGATSFHIDLPHPNVTLTDADAGKWEIRLDTELFPRGATAATGESLLTNSLSWSGNKLRITATHANDHSRTGQAGNSNANTNPQNYPASNSAAFQVFNNRQPLLTGFAVESNSTSSSTDASVDARLRFHFYDPDGSGAAKSAKITVDGQTVDCTKVNPYSPTALDPSSWDADYRCNWDAGTRDGIFSWSATVVDQDRGTNTNTTVSPVMLDLRNQAPTLTLSDPEPVDPVNLPVDAQNVTYEFRVHYSDTQSAPAFVRLQVGNTTLGIDRVMNMSRCAVQRVAVLDNLDSTTVEDVAGVVGSQHPSLQSQTANLGDGRDGEFCAQSSFARGTNWTWTATAQDIRGAGTGAIPDDLLRIPLIDCDHCVGEEDQEQALDNTQLQFNGVIGALNGLPPLPVSGWDLDDVAGVPLEDDGDFVPGLIEAMLFETDIFTATGVPGAYQYNFEDSWSIEIKRPTGGGTSSHSALRITVSSDPDDPLYKLDVCSDAAACQLQNQDIGLVTFETTPTGFILRGFDQVGQEVLRLAIDISALGSETKPFAVVHVGPPAHSLWANVTTNPLGVEFQGTGLFASYNDDSLYDIVEQSTTLNQSPYNLVATSTWGPDGHQACVVPVSVCTPQTHLPLAGFDSDDDQTVVWIDQDGAGPGPREELGADTGLVDGDNDGYPDASEVLVCYFLENPFDPSDGHCTDDNGDFILDNYHPA